MPVRLNHGRGSSKISAPSATFLWKEIHFPIQWDWEKKEEPDSEAQPLLRLSSLSLSGSLCSGLKYIFRSGLGSLCWVGLFNWTGKMSISQSYFPISFTPPTQADISPSIMLHVDLSTCPGPGNWRLARVLFISLLNPQKPCFTEVCRICISKEQKVLFLFA